MVRVGFGMTIFIVIRAMPVARIRMVGGKWKNIMVKIMANTPVKKVAGR